MAIEKINALMCQRRDTAANWTTNNPILEAGEIGIESDTNKIKIGNGTDNWNTLEYIGIDEEKLVGEKISEGGEIFNDYTNNTATGLYSHAEGEFTTATGTHSHAEGFGTTVSGNFSHAEGNGTTVSGSFSHAEGDFTIASSDTQHVQGKFNIEDTENKYAHIVGNGTDLTRSNAHTLDWNGNAWFAGDIFVGGESQEDTTVKKIVTNISDGAGTSSIQQMFDGGTTLDFTNKNANATANDSSLTGNLTRGAIGNYSTSLGGKSIAIGKRSVAEGTTTIAKGAYSHAEGDNSVTLGDDSHAEGYMTTAAGNYSHTEGGETIAKKHGAHAEGYQTIAEGQYTHSEGFKSYAKGNESHAEGYNTSSGAYAAHAEGNKTIAGIQVHKVNSQNQSSKTYVVNDASSFIVGRSFGCRLESGVIIPERGTITKIEGNTITVDNYINIAGIFMTNVKDPSTSSGGDSGGGDVGNPESDNIYYFGQYSHAEGGNTKALQNGAHAEGLFTTSNGPGAHAEGYYSTASGTYSHAEGTDTKALGDATHAEGNNTTASGDSTHAEGGYTTARGQYQHVQGKYNIEDTENKYAHIVGNGTAPTRSNAHTLDWNGNAWFAGDVMIGGGSQEDTATTKLSEVAAKVNAKLTKPSYDINNKLVTSDMNLDYWMTTDYNGSTIYYADNSVCTHNHPELPYTHTTGFIFVSDNYDGHDNYIYQYLTFISDCYFDAVSTSPIWIAIRKIAKNATVMEWEAVDPWHPVGPSVNEVNDLKDEITSLTSEINALKSRISALETPN